MSRALAYLAAASLLLAACGDETPLEATNRGTVILRAEVSGPAGRVNGAAITIFTEYSNRCQPIPPAFGAALGTTDINGVLRIEAEAPGLVGGTCFSLTATPPIGSGLRASERIPFLLFPRRTPPFDSTVVRVTLLPNAP